MAPICLLLVTSFKRTQYICEKCLVSSFSYFSKLPNLMGTWKPKAQEAEGCWLSSEVGSSALRCSIHLHSVRIELNHGTSAWCLSENAIAREYNGGLFLCQCNTQHKLILNLSYCIQVYDIKDIWVLKTFWCSMNALKSRWIENYEPMRWYLSEMELNGYAFFLSPKQPFSRLPRTYSVYSTAFMLSG